MTFEHFQSSGNIPVIMERLKIILRESEIKSGHSLWPKLKDTESIQSMTVI